MKKFSVVFLLLVSIILCSCRGGYRIDVEGIENFDKSEGYTEINVYLLPSDDFLEEYPYTSIQYNHKEEFKSYLSIAATECSLIVINYDDRQYGKAKDFCLHNMDLINSFEYNGYVFTENVMLAIGQNRLNKDNSIVCPEWFNMFAYNDEKCCLVFIGANILDGISVHTKTDPIAWDKFLLTYFSEFYNFGK